MWRGFCDEECASISTPAAAESAAPEVTGLRADIIPQRQFALRRWFSANPLWYYHAPATTHAIRANPRFFGLVDPAIRELCECLITAGLRTTPSCQGHFYTPERFEKIWDELNRESAAIRTTGLIVRDSESGRPYRFHEPNYSLPWPDFDTFHHAAAASQSYGYVGIIVPRRLNDIAVRLAINPYHAPAARIESDRALTIIFGEPTFGAYVDASAPDERDNAWRDLTEHVKRILSIPADSTVG